MDTENKIKVVVVDDEDGCMSSILSLIRENCPELLVIGTAQNVAEGVKLIDAQKPELVFLDINLPDGDGFKILDKVNYRNFEVIFTTAFDKYALKAFEFSALHYLLKPIVRKELIEAVERFIKLKSKFEQHQRYEVFKENYTKSPNKYILEALNGFLVLEIGEIIKAESSGKFTIMHMKDQKQHVINKYISTIESELKEMGFFRIHNSFLVNMKHIERFVKGRQAMLYMTNGDVLEVSQRKTAEFIEAFQEFVNKENR